MGPGADRLPSLRLISTHYLDDGKGFNQGQEVELIHIQDPGDYDALVDNIISSNYYGSSYFEHNIGHTDRKIKVDNLYISSIVEHLGPRRLLELGCGRGDVLLLLKLRGFDQVFGVDISESILDTLWPPLKGQVECGDFLEVCRRYVDQGRRFDTFVALDIWEHLHPALLHDYIQVVMDLAAPDALLFCVIPAFGPDPVFGEIFPLEFAENRTAFEQGRPFDYLIAEKTDPPIPSNGHLIWAPSSWWQAQFESRGLVRVPQVEANLHTYFDDHFYYSQKAFFIFRPDTPQAQSRVEGLLKKRMRQPRKARLLIEHHKAVQRFGLSQGLPEILNSDKIVHDVNHTYYLIEDAINRRAAKAVGLVFGQGLPFRAARKLYQPLVTWGWRQYQRRFLSM